MRRMFVVALLAVSAAVLQTSPAEAVGGVSFDEQSALICDADVDSDVDTADLTIIRNANGQTASGPGDPRDGNGDGTINIADVRSCQLQCTRSGCAVNPALVAVPNVIGQPQGTAVATLAAGPGNFVANAGTANHPTVPVGQVISQNPAAGTNAAPGSTVNITVSLGPALVAVPNVVGQTEGGAIATLAAGPGNFNPNVATANHPTVPVGQVISQNPAAGTNAAPGSTVDITVSLGPAAGPVATSLELALGQPVIGAGGSIPFTATVRDASDAVIAPTPGITYQIVSDGSAGAAPTVNGTQILTGATTRGAFRLRGSVTGTTVTTDVQFAVLQGGATTGNSGKIVNLGVAQDTIADKLTEISAAFDAGNPGAIAALNTAMQAARNTVLLTGRNAMERSTVVAPDVGFLPTTAQLTAGGFPETADDIAFGTLLPLIQAKLDETRTFFSTLNPASANDDEAKLNLLNSQLSALQAQLVALNVTPHGVVKHQARINVLFSNTFPRHLHAVASRIGTVLQQNALASASPAPEGLLAESGAPRAPGTYYAQARPAFFGLGGMLGAGGLQMKLVQKIYGPILAQLARVMVLVGAQGLLQSYANFASLEGIITGASLSFHAYDMPGSVIEGSGMNTTQVSRNDVFLVGTAAVSAVETLISSFNPSNINSLQDVYNFFDGIINAIQGAGQAYTDAHQLPASVQVGCILGGGSCSQLVYPSGFSSVTSCSGFFCFPEPVIVIYKNLDSGQFASGIFNFVP